MKIKVWQGATLNEATLNLVKNIDNSDMDKEHFVIVPDRFSLCMERLLLQNLPRKAMFNVSVMGLSALVVRLLSEIGISKIETISMSDALLLTAQAIKNKSSEFQTFKKSNINFCHEVYKVISQFKSSGVKPEELFIKQGSLSQQRKYHDLGVIYQEYETLLNGRLDANSLLDYFNVALASSGALENKCFYFAQFDSFTHSSYEVIKTLAQFAGEVNIALAHSITPANEYIYETDIMQKLRTLATELGVTIEVEAPRLQLNTGAKQIAEHLYSLDQTCNGDANDFLTLIASSTVQEEVELIAKIIRYKVVNGQRYKDFAIACSGLEKYGDIFTKILTQLEIPYYIDKAETADNTLLATFVFKVLNVFVKDYSAESLQALCADPIFNEPQSESLCKTIQSHNIYGKNRYKKHFAQASAKLDKLLSSFEAAEDFASLCGVCKNVIEEFATDYDNLLETLKERGMDKEYNINMQMKEILLDALDKIASYRGNEKCSKSEFMKLLKLLLSFKEVSSVPTYVDAVMIGDATSSYFGQVQNLIIVGGEALPTLSGDNGLVSDDDIEKLSAVRKIEPSIRMINRRNRFKLFNLLCSAQCSLIVSYLEVNDEGKRVEVPAYIDGLSKIFGAKIVNASSFSRFARVNPEVDLQKLLLSSGNRKLALENGLLEEAQFVDNKTALNVEAEKLFFPKGYTKVTQLECYFSCPFKHFVRYGLRAKEAEKYEFDPRDIGNVCHKLAEDFVAQNKTNLGALTESEIRRYIDAHLFDAIVKEGLEDKLNITIDKDGVLDYLNRMAVLLLTRICEEQRFSQFRPAFIEKSLEGELECGKGKMKLIGKIDRIDTAGQYYRIMDYKTGAVAPILKDLYYGDKLQLFLYEKVAGDALGKIPAGAFYFDARWDYDKEAQKDAILKGIVVNDETALSMFDYRLQEGKSEIIAVSKSGKGYKGASLAKFSLATFEGYAKKVASKALSETLDGYIEPKPDQAACDKCPFKSICLFDKQLGFRKKDKVTQEDIARAMEVRNA